MATDADLVLVPSGRQARRAIAASLVRALMTSVGVLWLYAAVPGDGRLDLSGAVVLVGGLVVFVTMVAIQIRSITRARAPRLRAIEATATVLPLFLVLFASAYSVISAEDPGAFSDRLTRLDAFYFTVTVFSTVGFGDITAVSPAARVAVTVQMIANLVVLGLGVRVILGAVRIGLARRPTP